jgi:hypothetical protein
MYFRNATAVKDARYGNFPAVAVPFDEKKKKVNDNLRTYEFLFVFRDYLSLVIY